MLSRAKKRGKKIKKDERYVYYDDAWWLNALNVSTGEFPKNAFAPVATLVERFDIEPYSDFLLFYPND